MKLIFTTHAEERRRYRKIAESDIEHVLKRPDKTFPGKKPDTVKFIKFIDGRQHQVVAKFLKDQNAWLILSVWIRGEEDSNWMSSLISLIKNIFSLFKR